MPGGKQLDNVVAGFHDGVLQGVQRNLAGIVFQGDFLRLQVDIDIGDAIQALQCLGDSCFAVASGHPHDVDGDLLHRNTSFAKMWHLAHH